MSMPFYVPPEQFLKDRADFARKGISRGRTLIAAGCAEGILVVAENPSTTLRKISEIYDRIAFAGVGKYNEYDSLRMAGVRQADLQGYQFSRRDVDARRLANLYAQVLAHEFTAGPKPLEVEILVAEVGEARDDDRLYRISYDGTVMDEDGLCILGGDTEAVAARCAGWQHDDTLAGLLKAAVAALSGPERSLAAVDLEVAILARNGRRRCFSRLEEPSVTQMLG
ncbi:MAG: proteasome subunit alpha [Actinomycetota bacterium]|jgi:proteasome alpha subunit